MPTEVWIPDAYLRSSMPRTQGVLDLLARVEHPRPRLVADLGCGPGNNTELISERWPEARVIGVDSSPDMIAAARKRWRPGQLEFRQADLAEWQPDEPCDVVLLNAVLQWIPGHPALLPQLVGLLAPGGVLGFQMPCGVAGGSRRSSMMDIAHELIAEQQWRDKLGGVYADPGVLDPESYIAALGDLGLRAEAWETTYAYPLTGGDRLLEYACGAILRPALAALAPPEAEQFLAEYSQRVSLACPPRVIGGESVEVLHVTRVFAVGQSG